MHPTRNLQLATRLHKMRLRFGETQRTFCRYFKIHRTTYGSWERLGPPDNSVAAYVRIVLEKLKHRVEMREYDGRKREKKEAEDTTL